MLNENEIVPEGATHKWVDGRALGKWYKPGDYSEALVFRNNEWVSSAFENDALNDANCFTPLNKKGYTPPSLKDWDDRYPNITKPRSKYHKMIKGVEIDVYDVLHAYGVTNQADAHAIKKLLMAGQRGYKDANQDRREAIASIERGIELEGGK